MVLPWFTERTLFLTAFSLGMLNKDVAVGIILTEKLWTLATSEATQPQK